ncbi:lipid asymmetry maintenance protein MlaB, partial [Bradyrhizobium neotropicale]
AQLGQAREAGNAALHIDCAGLSQVDSSALAVLLSWQRTAQDAGITLDIAGAPQALSNLATLYGLESLLAIAPAPAAHHHARH